MKQKSSIQWVWRNVKKDFKYIVLLSVIEGLISGGFVIFALLSRTIINTAVDKGRIWNYVIFLAIVLLAQAVLNILDSRMHTFVSGRLTIKIQRVVFSSLYRKRWQSVNTYHSGDVLNRLTSDVTGVVTGVTTLIPRAVSLTTRLAASVIVLFVLDVRFTLIMLAAGVTVLVFSRFYGKWMKKLHKEAQTADGKTRSYIQECVENWLAVQSFGGIDAIKIQLKRLQEKHFKLTLRRTRIGNMSSTSIYLLFSGCYYAALVWGAVCLAAGSIRIGDLTAFLQIVSQIQTPFRSASGLLPGYYGMLASAERLIELEQLDEETAGELPPDIYDRLDEICVENMTFSYDAAPVLKNAGLTIRKGEFIAFAGSSGIGKSTLFKLLLGFLEPSEGSITLRCGDESVPLTATARSLFAYVPQGNLILSGTIRQNITFFADDIEKKRIWDAAETAEIADFIRGLEQGLETRLGERGLGLSEGQVQRLAIARALLYNSPILLLDEATAALDEQTEARVLENIRRLSDKTCLCISHRPPALATCDRVIYIENGRFVSHE